MLAVLLLLLGAGCGRAAEPDCGELALAVLESQPGPESMTRLDSASASFAGVMESVYGVEPETLRAGTVYYGTDASPKVIMVLRANDASEAAAAAGALEAYIEKRIEVFDGYAPASAAELRGRTLVRTGSYVGLFVCPEPQEAAAVFSDAFLGRLDAAADSAAAAVPARSPLPDTDAQSEDPGLVPGTEKTSPAAFSREAVVDAWNAGSPESLTGQSRAVYDRAQRILSSIVRPDMSDYEKEVAVHDYLTGNIEYDPDVLEGVVEASRDLESATAYGALVLGKGICYGYADSFQLLMDLLGIECITVDGTGNASGNPHSWNMVCLDGLWYCVDVTWDDPSRGRPSHGNLNVTTAYMLEYGNRRPSGEVPETIGGPWAGPGIVQPGT